MKRVFTIFFRLSMVVVVLTAVYGLVIHYYMDNWQTSGTFGDTFGLLTAIFSGLAFAGLIATIIMQWQGIQHSRDAATQERITNIIYHQFDRIEKAIEEFEIKSNGLPVKGHAAFLELKNKIATFYPISYEGASEQEKFIARKELNTQNHNIYLPNQDAISVLAIRCYNAVQIVKQTLLHSQLTVTQINQLKSLLFDNIGFIHMNVFQKICDHVDDYFKLYNEDNDYLLDLGSLNVSPVFLNPLLNSGMPLFPRKIFLT